MKRLSETVEPKTYVTMKLDEKHVKDLYYKLIQELRNYEFDACIAVTKGGLIPSYYLCRELGIDAIDTVSLKSYQDGDKTPSPLKLYKGASILFTTKCLLVLDDICDTGRTFQWIRERHPYKQSHLVFATLVCKSRTDLVDHYGMIVPDTTWVTFPWELP